MTFNFPQHVKQIMLVKGGKKTSNRTAFDDNAVCQSVLYIQGFYLSDWLIVPQTYEFSSNKKNNNIIMLMINEMTNDRIRDDTHKVITIQLPSQKQGFKELLRIFRIIIFSNGILLTQLGQLWQNTLTHNLQ